MSLRRRSALGFGVPGLGFEALARHVERRALVCSGCGRASLAYRRFAALVICSGCWARYEAAIEARERAVIRRKLREGPRAC